ncbi:hypothetical protein HK102_013695 [Quaeritorhiza haematococci]|nr:hypothetical protein HK102_013695 [Quaeritorhiza haematococci]
MSAPQRAQGKPQQGRGNANAATSGSNPEYREFKLESSRRTLPHHVMKIQSQKFDIKNLTQPVRLARATPPSAAMLAAQQEEEKEALAAQALEREKMKTVPQQLSEKYDPNKVAPLGMSSGSGRFGGGGGGSGGSGGESGGKTKQFFKKKTRSFFFGRDPDEELEKADSEEGRKKRQKDPDRYPWILQDAEGKEHYEGKVEGAQTANYVLFMFSVSAV